MTDTTLKYLIIGHPRCGSGFGSLLLNNMGIKCSHEIEPVGKQALSSWAFLIEHEENDNIYPRYGLGGSGWRKKYSFKHKITHLRNPFKAFPSIINENDYDWSFNIRSRYIKKKLNEKVEGNKLEKAIQCYLHWNEIAIRESELYFKIEMQEDFLKLITFFETRGEKLNNLDFSQLTKVNSKPKEKQTLSLSDFKFVSSDIKRQLESFCSTHGYDYILS